VQSEKLASLGQLTAGIAHEIKNPLNFVNNFADLSVDLVDELRAALDPGKAPLDEATRVDVDEVTEMLSANLTKISRHGRRADSIVKNMLLHSRESGSGLQKIDLNASVEESLALAFHGARAEKPGFNMTLEKDLDEAVGEIELYPQEFTRVLLNLISNGFYAAHQRKLNSAGAVFEPTLRVATRSLGEQVEIRSGTTAPAFRGGKAKMFNPFFTTKPAGEGTGLGLSLSFDIVVKQHGGRIDVDTRPDEFTEFVVTLPRRPTDGPENEEPVQKSNRREGA
jgi:signal transduction histidine kinase